MIFHINGAKTGEPDLDILAGVVLQAVRDAQSGDPVLAPPAWDWLAEFAPELPARLDLKQPAVAQMALF